MLWLHYAQTGLALVLTLIAAWTDYRTGTIPNRLTIPSLFLGLGLGLASGTASSFLLAIAGAFATALVPLVLFRFGAMGGGDVKLFAAVGALLGAGSALEAEILAFFLGAIQGMVVWYRNGQLKQGLLLAATLAIPSRLKKHASLTGPVQAVSTEIRFGPAIFIATLATVTLRSYW
ncbi:MAG: prepilin peptidase [Proteobacteria bacterium]|nr:prepilin peptidase [Pseudomonadota bacterium]